MPELLTFYLRVCRYAQLRLRSGQFNEVYLHRSLLDVNGAGMLNQYILGLGPLLSEDHGISCSLAMQSTTRKLQEGCVHR